MKAVYMRQLYMGTIGDIKNLEVHFAEMAMDGWMIDKIGGLIHRYRAIEPTQKRFSVDFLPYITDFDYPENEDAQDYLRICEESGWIFVTTNNQLHVFCADEGTAEPTPIHTDNKIQAQIYLKMSKKYELSTTFDFIFPMFIFVIILFQISHNGMELLVTNLLMFCVLGCLFFLIGAIWRLGFIIHWYQRTRKSAKLGLPLPTVNYRLSQIRNKVYVAGIIVSISCLVAGFSFEVILGIMPISIFVFAVMSPLVALLVVVVAGLRTRQQIYTEHSRRKVNITLAIITFVIFIISDVVIFRNLQSTLNHCMPVAAIGNRPALILYDLGIPSEPVHTYSFVGGSVIVPLHYSHWEMNSQGTVKTEIYRPISPLITQGLYNRFIRELEKWHSNELWVSYSEITHFTPVEAAFWGVDEGVSAIDSNGHSTDLILRNGRTILRLSIRGEGIVEKEIIVQAVRNLTSD